MNLFRSEVVVAATIALLGAFAGAYAGIEVGRQQYEIQRELALVDMVTKMNTMEPQLLHPLLDRLSRSNALRRDDMSALCKAFNYDCSQQISK